MKCCQKNTNLISQPHVQAITTVHKSPSSRLCCHLNKLLPKRDTHTHRHTHIHTHTHTHTYQIPLYNPIYMHCKCTSLTWIVTIPFSRSINIAHIQEPIFEIFDHSWGLYAWMVKKDAAKSLIENLFPTLRHLKFLPQRHTHQPQKTGPDSLWLF